MIVVSSELIELRNIEGRQNRETFYVWDESLVCDHFNEAIVSSGTVYYVVQGGWN